MKRPAAKKLLPPWVSVAAIVALVVILALVWFTQFARPKGQSESQLRARAQELVNQGFQPPGLSREKLEKMGVKYPADFEERAKKFQERLSSRGGRGR